MRRVDFNFGAARAAVGAGGGSAAHDHSSVGRNGVFQLKRIAWASGHAVEQKC
jgi:hypothetical protein